MKIRTIEIICGTRLSQSEFWAKAALGISLRRFANAPQLTTHIAFENTRGLPEIFNARINAVNSHDILIFVHDDVWIDDESFIERVLEGLDKFDVVGIAGNRRRLPNQSARRFTDDKYTWDEKSNLSGSIAHGKYPLGEISDFDPTPKDCELLDGVFIAARKTMLKSNGVAFDPRLDFHFYDLDFCRSARSKGLRLGTWPIKLTHQSVGAFGSPAWINRSHLYLDKWKSFDANNGPSHNILIAPTSLLQPIKLLKTIFGNSGNLPSNHQDRPSHDELIPESDLHGEFEINIKRGNDLLSQGNLSAAAECYGHAIAVNPCAPEGFLNLGFVLIQLDSHRDAERYLKHAIRLNPRLEDAHYLLGTIAQSQGKLEDAINHYNNALKIKPGFEEVYLGLCRSLFLNGNIEAAKKTVKRALELNSQNADFHCYEGNLYSHEKQTEKAMACYQRALKLQPDFLSVHTNIGHVLMQAGKVDEALVAYEEALSINSDCIEASSCMLFIRSFHLHSTPEQYLAAAQHFGKTVSALAKPFTKWPNELTGCGTSPLRIGLVSGDFNEHPVGFFLGSTLQHLNRDRFELVAYYSSPKQDQITTRLKPYFSVWNSIVDLSDEALAHKIHNDGIDILIDLAGHTLYNRLPVFAWKPAPVQVSWLGFFASTGVPGMDYLLADPVAVPESHQKYFTEQIWYLPSTRMCFTPPTAVDELPPAPPPSLLNGYITFGCFQSLTKITDETLSTWARILLALPKSKLRLQNKQILSVAGAREDTERRLAQFGIDPQRVISKGSMPRNEYLAAHAEVDIILDTSPYPGGTTTCEALWMGVPTITLLGNTLLSRQGASLLSCVGLLDWIAQDVDDYVARAIAHASDLNGLSQLRAELRQKSNTSPLFDAPRFALDLETALENMWRQFSLN